MMVMFCSQKGYTPLLLACEYKNIGLVEMLFDREELSEPIAVTNVSSSCDVLLKMLYSLYTTGW